jgi:hypothetical protein
MLGCLSMLSVVATAIGAGLGKFSFWWVLIPVFLAGSFALSNGPAFYRIVQANQQGRLGVFPIMLGTQLLFWLIVAGAVFWLTTTLS